VLLVLKGHTDAISSASFSPDGSRIVTASYDRTARVWDARTGAEVLSLKGHTDRVSAASFSADGSRILTASWDNSVKVWDSRPFSISVVDDQNDPYRMIRAKSIESRLYLNQGKTLLGQQRLDDAVLAFREAIRLNRDDARPYILLGEILEEQRKFDEAAAAYREAIRLGPEDLRVRNNLVRVLSNFVRIQGRRKEAMAEIRELARLRSMPRPTRSSSPSPSSRP
jgi:hypothetical protein